MSNKDLFKQAIAEAKTIREAAITNAKEALEESLTPHLKEMLAQKLQEMEDADEIKEYGMEHNDRDENGDGKVDGEDTRLSEEEEEEVEAEEEEGEEAEEEGEEEGEEVEEEELDLENMSVEEFKDLVRDIVAQEIGQEGSEEEMPGEEAPEGEEDMVGIDSEEEIDINELLAELAEMNNEPKEGNVNEDLKADMKALAAKYGKAFEDWITRTGIAIGGEEGLGLNKPSKGIGMEEAVNEDLKADMKALAAKYGQAFDDWITRTGKMIGGEEGLGLNKPGGMGPKMETVNEDLKADMKALADKYGKAFEDWITRTGKMIGGEEGLGLNKPSSGIGMEEEVDEELAEALETVAELRTQLQEVNLLNAKLLYVNKVFKSSNLSEGQKVNVIAAFDKAETVKEVKLVFETVSKNVVAKPVAIKEHKSFASSAAGTAATAGKKEIISEVSEQVARWQKLAGIIK